MNNISVQKRRWLTRQSVTLLLFAAVCAGGAALYEVDTVSGGSYFTEVVEGRTGRLFVPPLPDLEFSERIEPIIARDPFINHKGNAARAGPAQTMSVVQAVLINADQNTALIRMPDSAVYQVSEGESILGGRFTVLSVSPTSVELQSVDGERSSITRVGKAP